MIAWRIGASHCISVMYYITKCSAAEQGGAPAAAGRAAAGRRGQRRSRACGTRAARTSRSRSCSACRSRREIRDRVVRARARAANAHALILPMHSLKDRGFIACILVVHVYFTICRKSYQPCNDIIVLNLRDQIDGRA